MSYSRLPLPDGTGSRNPPTVSDRLKHRTREMVESGSDSEDDPQESEHLGPQSYTANGMNLQNDNGAMITSVGSGNKIYNNNITHNHDRSRDEAQRRKLLRRVIHDAMHTGNIRPDLRECDSRHHKEAIDDAVEWVQKKNRRKGVLWIYGPPGIGKSAVALRTCRMLDKPTSTVKVAGSFFFVAWDPRRNSLRAFVTTLVYRLSVCMQDHVANEIWRVMNQDPGILHAAVKVQWNKLIVETVNAVYERDPSAVPPAVVVIDGLEECIHPDEQSRILKLIASCGPNFPLAFIITSRDEPDSFRKSNGKPFSSHCRSIRLAPCGCIQTPLLPPPAFNHPHFSNFPNPMAPVPVGWSCHMQVAPVASSTPNAFGGYGSMSPIQHGPGMPPYGNRPYAFDPGEPAFSPSMPPSTMYPNTVPVNPVSDGPGSSEDVVYDVLAWIENVPRERGILWLFGPSGSGKSVVLGAIMVLLARPGARARIAASFTFNREDPCSSNFIRALVDQLIMFHPALGQDISQVMSANPDVWFAPWEVQWFQLITGPIRRVFSAPVPIPPAAILLGNLDKYGTPEVQQRVLQLISSCGLDFPFAFVITSKFEPHLAESFNLPPLVYLCRPSIDLTRCIDYQLGDKLAVLRLI